jgi:hypothetical protein
MLYLHKRNKKDTSSKLGENENDDDDDDEPTNEDESE